MVFSSTLFLFVFLPVTLAGYWLIRKELKNYWLLLVSLIFFGWSQLNYLWIILLNIAINYTAAMLIKAVAEKHKELIVTVGVCANLAILFYFKYFDFAIDSINKAFGTSFELFNIILPIGISFFTFQGMSYVIDVYRGEVDAQKNPLKVALYITLFPQLIAGPIVRYKDIAAEIDERSTSIEDFAAGVERFIIGLGKKAIIANTMASCVDRIWQNGAGNIQWISAWVGSIAYTLQIFFDFSGYSDMAIGLGRMFGFHFVENFNLPYISKSITEFWRRWHISLSTWFRDYVYIPLGGNRKHVYRNLLIVFFLTGLWHGASWNFLEWGGWNGLFLLIERFRRNKRKTTGKTEKESLPVSILKTIITLFIVNIGWVIFRAPNLHDAVMYLGNMFGLVAPQRVDYTALWYLDRWTVFCGLLGVIFSSALPKIVGQKLKKMIPGTGMMIFKYIVLLAILFLAMIRIVSGTYNPFIYFQF